MDYVTELMISPNQNTRIKSTRPWITQKYPLLSWPNIFELESQIIYFDCKPYSNNSTLGKNKCIGFSEFPGQCSITYGQCTNLIETSNEQPAAVTFYECFENDSSECLMNWIIERLWKYRQHCPFTGWLSLSNTMMYDTFVLLEGS